MADQRVGQINARPQKLRPELDRGPQVRYGILYMSLRQQHPAQRIVSLCTVGCEFHRLLKRGARPRQVTALHIFHSLLIADVGLRRRLSLRGRRLGERADSGQHNSARA